MRHTLPGLWMAFVFALPAGAEKKIIAPQGFDISRSCSPAVLAGDLAYLSGQMANRPGTLDLPLGIEAQVHGAMEHLGRVLEAGGMDFSRVVSSSVYLSDPHLFERMNQTYRTYFKESPPTRTTIQAELPVPGALVEISLIAVRPGVEKRVIKPAALKSPELPYSWGIQVGATLFIAGTTARNPSTYKPQGGGIKLQTKRVLQNVGLVLEAAGMRYSDVVNCDVFLDEAQDLQRMNEVYATFFPERPPARTTIRARVMNTAFLTEIQCSAVKDVARKAFYAPKRPTSPGPFSAAIKAGGRLFVSGTAGRGPKGFSKGDVAEQTRQALENLGAMLKAADLAFDDVVYVVVFLSNIRDLQMMNDVYVRMMPFPLPARTTVGVSLTPRDALVEIQMLAMR